MRSPLQDTSLSRLSTRYRSAQGLCSGLKKKKMVQEVEEEEERARTWQNGHTRCSPNLCQQALYQRRSPESYSMARSCTARLLQWHRLRGSRGSALRSPEWSLGYDAGWASRDIRDEQNNDCCCIIDPLLSRKSPPPTGKLLTQQEIRKLPIRYRVKAHIYIGRQLPELAPVYGFASSAAVDFPNDAADGGVDDSVHRALA